MKIRTDKKRKTILVMAFCLIISSGFTQDLSKTQDNSKEYKQGCCPMLGKASEKNKKEIQCSLINSVLGNKKLIMNMKMQDICRQVCGEMMQIRSGTGGKMNKLDAIIEKLKI